MRKLKKQSAPKHSAVLKINLPEKHRLPSLTKYLGILHPEYYQYTTKYKTDNPAVYVHFQASQIEDNFPNTANHKSDSE